MSPPKKPIRTISAVIDQIADSGGIRKLVLRQPDGWELPPFRPGAHIDIHLPIGLVESYSLCCNSLSQTEYVVAVKKDVGGRGGSIYIHEHLKQGDTIEISLPRCTFPLATPSKHHIFIAGGIGITPFISMAYELDALNQYYELHLFFRQHIPLASELKNIGVAGKIFLHDRADGQCDRLLAQLLDKPIPGAHVYCCGPPRMVEEFNALTTKWDADVVHVEHFIAPTLEPLTTSYNLVLKKSNLVLPVPAGGNALQVIHDAGVELDSSCEGGICGACVVEWIEGEPLHRDSCLTDTQRLQQFITCVGGCCSSRLVINL
ncbi:MAG: PDR/VanB family oxidoreductase [Herbaspirillum sp.]